MCVCMNDKQKRSWLLFPISFHIRLPRCENTIQLIYQFGWTVIILFHFADSQFDQHVLGTVWIAIQTRLDRQTTSIHCHLALKIQLNFFFFFFDKLLATCVRCSCDTHQCDKSDEIRFFTLHVTTPAYGFYCNIFILFRISFLSLSLSFSVSSSFFLFLPLSLLSLSFSSFSLSFLILFPPNNSFLFHTFLCHKENSSINVSF